MLARTARGGITGSAAPSTAFEKTCGEATRSRTHRCCCRPKASLRGVAVRAGVVGRARGVEAGRLDLELDVDLVEVLGHAEEARRKIDHGCGGEEKCAGEGSVRQLERAWKREKGRTLDHAVFALSAEDRQRARLGEIVEEAAVTLPRCDAEREVLEAAEPGGEKEPSSAGRAQLVVL